MCGLRTHGNDDEFLCFTIWAQIIIGAKCNAINDIDVNAYISISIQNKYNLSLRFTYQRILFSSIWLHRDQRVWRTTDERKEKKKKKIHSRGERMSSCVTLFTIVKYEYIDTNLRAQSAFERTNLTTDCRHTYETNKWWKIVEKKELLKAAI